jgi:cytochrome P450
MTGNLRCPIIDVEQLNPEHDLVGTYGGIRQGGAVTRCEAHGGFWTLLSYPAVKGVAMDATRFCSGQGATIPHFGNPIPAVPLEVDPPEHRAYRKLLVPALRPERVEEWADEIRAATDACIDAFIERGTADLAAELAHHVPPLIIAQILGLPPEDHERFAGWTVAMIRASAAGDVQANQAAAAALVQYVDGKVTEAEGHSGPGLMAIVANAVINGERIDHLAAMGFALTLILGGHDTTVNGIASALWLIGAHPATKQRLIDDPGLIPAAVEETLRLESPLQMLARTVTEDTTVEGVPMKAGDKVGLVWGSANLDETIFPNPERFDIDRPGNPHLAFGQGIHRCVGEYLARLEMRIAVEQILTRIPDYEIAGQVRIRADGVLSRGPLNVPVAFTPGARLGPE